MSRVVWNAARLKRSPLKAAVSGLGFVGEAGQFAKLAEGESTGEALLVEPLESNAVLVDSTAGSDAGIDVVRSEYATIAAENTALERLAVIVADEIVARLATYARARPAGEAPVARP